MIILLANERRHAMQAMVKLYAKIVRSSRRPYSDICFPARVCLVLRGRLRLNLRGTTSQPTALNGQVALRHASQNIVGWKAGWRGC